MASLTTDSLLSFGISGNIGVSRGRLSFKGQLELVVVVVCWRS